MQGFFGICDEELAARSRTDWMTNTAPLLKEARLAMLFFCQTGIRETALAPHCSFVNFVLRDRETILTVHFKFLKREGSGENEV